MATYTVTTAVNIDTLTTKAGDDTYNINGGFLTIDQDSRYGLNNNTSATMGSVSPSTTLGGTITIDARAVRIIPYDAGSGNVPAAGTTISGSTGSGILIGVYDTLAVAPTTAGSAMPADGYIKIKQWDSVAFTDNDALTGIGATVTTDPVFGGTDRVGWIEVVGTETPRNWTFGRLNNPTTPLTQGDWLLVGITDGTRSTTYQIPSNGVNQYHGGVWVENPNSTAVTSASYSSSSKRVTYQVTAHGFETGDLVTISGITPSTYNTEAYITKIDANSFYCYIVDPDNPAVLVAPGTYTSGGTAAGNWEFYPATSDTFVSTNLSTSALKGKWCSISTAGLVRFGHDGTNSSGGYCPPTGRKIRMPNVFMTGATSAAKTQNSYNSSVGSRPRFITSGAARLDLQYASFNWGFGSLSNTQLFNLTNCAVVDSLTISNPSSQLVWNDVGIGSPQVPNAATKVTIANAPFGMSFTKVVAGFVNQTTTANMYCIGFTDSADILIDKCRLVYSGQRGVAGQPCINMSRVDGIDITNSILAHAINGSSSSNGTLVNCIYYDQNGGINLPLVPVYAATFTTTSNNWDINGLMISGGDLPRTGLLTVGSSSANVTMKNVGSYSDPIGSGGMYVEDGAGWTRSTTTATVTTASPHGFTNNDVIVIYRSSSIAAIILAAATITVTGASTFTFTCLNAGDASGTISFYFGTTARVFGVSNADLTKIQNVHIRGIRTAIFSTDNTDTNTYIENVQSDELFPLAMATPPNNLRMYGSTQPPLNQVGSSALYGTLIHTGYCGTLSVPNATGCSWTRSAAVVTVTKADHGLVTASKIQVFYTDNQTGAYTAQTANVTVLTKDTFTFTGASSGTTSGTVLDYKTSDGMLVIEGNEDNTASDSQFSVIAGTPLFTGSGSIYMPTVNDEVEWVTDRYINDFDYAENMLPLMAGGTISDYTMTYDIDTGSGYSGSYKNAYFQSAGGGGSAASTTVTMTSTTGVNAGDYIYGIGIATGAKVVSITNSTDIVVDTANAATVSGTLRFSYLPNITSIPSTGFKMKVRLKTITANTNAVSYIRLFFRSTSASRQRVYQQETLPTQTVTISGATAGTRIQLYDLTSSTELYNGTPTFPYTWTDPEEYVADREIRLRASYVSGTTAKEYISTTIGTATLTDYALSYLITPANDTVYNANAVNGSTTTGITISATRYSLTVSRTMAQIYAFAMYTAFTETGIRDYGLAISAVDTANYFLDEVLLKNTSSGPAIAISITGGWVRDFDTGVALDLVDTTGGTLFLAPDHVVAYASASDYALVADAVWSDTATYTGTEKGAVLQDSADSAELASIK